MRDLEDLAPAGVALIGLVVAIVLRRRLDRAAPFAIAAFAVLSLSRLGSVAWRQYLNAVLSRPEAGMLKGTPPYTYDANTPQSSIDMLDVNRRVLVGVTVVTALGLALLVTAILAGRGGAPETPAPSPDSAIPDSAIPDSAIPDSATPDNFAADNA
jgi:hypothetical protein